jgi:hypothetical protein
MERQDTLPEHLEGGRNDVTESPNLIRMNITRYREMLKFPMDPERRSIVKQLLGWAEDDLAMASTLDSKELQSVLHVAPGTNPN